MKNEVENLKKFIKIALVWILTPGLCILLKELILFFPNMSEGILLYFLILEMVKRTKEALKK